MVKPLQRQDDFTPGLILKEPLLPTALSAESNIHLMNHILHPKTENGEAFYSFPIKKISTSFFRYKTNKLS
jgi:hypothetical protein